MILSSTIPLSCRTSFTYLGQYKKLYLFPRNDWFCSGHVMQLPIVFLLAMSSPSSTFLNDTYSRETIALLRVRTFTAPSGPPILQEILLKVGAACPDTMYYEITHSSRRFSALILNRVSCLALLCLNIYKIISQDIIHLPMPYIRFFRYVEVIYLHTLISYFLVACTLGSLWLRSTYCPGTWGPLCRYLITISVFGIRWCFVDAFSRPIRRWRGYGKLPIPYPWCDQPADSKNQRSSKSILRRF